MAVLAAGRRPCLTLGQWHAARASQASSRPGPRPPAGAVIVTFDDGYADNLDVALPIMEQSGVPATVFLTTDFIGGTEPWWDDIEQMVFDEAPSAPSVPGWAQARGTVLDDRQHAYVDLWKRLSVASPAARAASMAAQWDRSGRTRRLRPEHAMLTADQVRRVAALDHVEVGSHGLTHQSLPLLDDLGLEAELAGSRDRLATLTGASVDSLAYPSGQWDQRVAEAARLAGYRRAVTTDRGLVGPGSDAMSLPRIAVPDCDGDAFERMLSDLG